MAGEVVGVHYCCYPSDLARSSTKHVNYSCYIEHVDLDRLTPSLRDAPNVGLSVVVAAAVVAGLRRSVVKDGVVVAAAVGALDDWVESAVDAVVEHTDGPSRRYPVAWLLEAQVGD